jgi:hypothetical protein
MGLERAVVIGQIGQNILSHNFKHSGWLIISSRCCDRRNGGY